MIYLEKPQNFEVKSEVVGCFVERGRKILLLLRQNHKPQGNSWGLPGGKVNEGEDKDVAIKRELVEETGIVGDNFQYQRTVYVKYPEFNFVYHMYKLVYNGNEHITIDQSAHKDYKWVDLQEALKMELILDLDKCIDLCFGKSN